MKRLRWIISISVLLSLPWAARAAPIDQWELGVVLTRTPDVKNGAALYETCAACHGVRGEGASDGSAPALGGQSYTVVAKQIVDFRAGVRSDPRMVHFTDSRHLAFSQPVADVAMYIANLPAPAPKQAPAGVDVNRGATTYARVCARCHGDVGEGKEDTLAPRVAGQHANYIMNQLDSAADKSRATLVRSHADLERTLTRKELEAVAAWLGTL
jgi:cytochrome c oxidase subunit 2